MSAPKFQAGERVKITGLPGERGRILDPYNEEKDRAFIGMWGTVKQVVPPNRNNNEHGYRIQLDTNNVSNAHWIWPEASIKALDAPSEADRIRNEFLKLIGIDNE